MARWIGRSMDRCTSGSMGRSMSGSMDWSGGAVDRRTDGGTEGGREGGREGWEAREAEGAALPFGSFHISRPYSAAVQLE